jgi:pilus assembly protein TadC
MANRHPNIWKWLPFIALGLMLVGDFAPISDSLDEILSGMAIAILFAFYVTYFWQERRTRQADQANSAAVSTRDQM